MSNQLLTVFAPDEVGLATLWARGLQAFWPDHPPVLLLSDGRTDEDTLLRVAEHCHATVLPDRECRTLLCDLLPADIAGLANTNFWVRNLYLPSLACAADVLVWDDVDGLFLRRPETWIRGITEHPKSCCSVWQHGYGIPEAVDIWGRVAPDVMESYTKMAPAHGTHSAPVSMVKDAMPLLFEFHREWARSGKGAVGGAVCEMGAWQGIASRHRPAAALNVQLYQIDFLQLQKRPEMYHACTEKRAKWFWEAFLSGYGRHLADPADDFKAVEWIQA